jgi:Flp pilus assembly protein CpaB
LKRSNRLVLLVGVFLAIVAFVGILLLAQNPGPGTGGKASAPPTTGPVVVAAVDIPLSTRIRAEQLQTIVISLTAKLPGAFTDPSQVVGQIARQPVATGAQVTSATLSGGVNGTITTIQTPLGLRSIAVRVDQNTGVGTAIKTGDYVDMIIGLTADKFPVITIDPTSKAITVVSGLNSTSVKVLLQGLQVVGTLLPPVPPPTTSAGASASPPPSTGNGPISLNDQQEIVILAGTAQQAEVIKFAQMDSSITLVLRSPDDFIDPLTGAPLPPVTTETTGVILKTLVDSYGVLAPELVQTVTPTATRRP